MEAVPWPHAPTHHLSASGTYFVTAGTYGKQHCFRKAERLDVLQRGLLKVSAEFGWRLEAWAIFSNHYHFVAHSPSGQNAESLSTLINALHSKTANWINRLDSQPARKVWHNFWDTQLTFQRSYLARLNYVHHNAVHHRLVSVANQYPWCSAGWFERNASAAQIKALYRFKTDTVGVFDEYDPVIGDA